MKTKLLLVVVIVILLAGGSYYYYFSVGHSIDAVSILRQAEEAIAAKDFTKASSLTARVLAHNPEHARAKLISGRILAAEANWDEALELFRSIPDLSIDGPAARYYEGLCYIGKNRSRDAERAFFQALQQSPEMIGAHEQLANLYASQLRAVEMRGQLIGLLNLRELSLEEIIMFVTQGITWATPSRRAARMSAYLDGDGEDVASALALARTYLEEQRNRAAETALRPLSHDPAIQGLRAIALLKLRDVPGSAACLAKAPETIPFTLWMGRAEYAAATGDAEGAEAYFRQAVRLRPDDILANYRLGHLLEQDNHADAPRFLQRALNLQELHQKCFYLLGLSETETRQRGDALEEIGRLLAKLDRWFEAALVFELLAATTRSSAANEQLQQALNKLNEKPPEPEQTPEEIEFKPVEDDQEGATAAPPAAVSQSIQLRDVHESVGLDFWYFPGESGLKYLIESMGGGVSVFDYDADGWPDFHFAQGCRLPIDRADSTYTNQLFRNRFGGEFEDVSAAAGIENFQYGIGCSTGDYDNDGFVDLLVTNYGRNTFYRNNGDGTFSDVTDQVGIEGERMSTSSALADLDNDGDLDIYVANYLVGLKVCRGEDKQPVTCHPRTMPAEQDVLYRNDGQGQFADITESAGIKASGGKGLGVVVVNLDEDHWPEIYVANDTTPNFLFRNLAEAGSVRFAENGLASGTALNVDGQSEAGMGIACADFDGNQSMDLYVTNYHQESNTLYLNKGRFLFEDATRTVGLAEPTLPVLGFGAQAVDFDLDGLMDLFVANGHVEDARKSGSPWKMPPQLFRQSGPLEFQDLSLDSGGYFEGKYLGRGAGRCDWNRDHRPDLVVVHQDRAVALLQNESAVGNWVTVEAVGRSSNRDAINVRFRITIGAQQRIFETCAGDGYLGNNERRQIFGTGEHTSVDLLEVLWPSGTVDRWEKIPCNRHWKIFEGSEALVEVSGKSIE